MSSNKKGKTIKEVALGAVEIAAKGAINAIPGGSIAISIFDAVKGGCLEKRQAKWRDMIEDRLGDVEKTLEEIGNSDAFATTLIKATEIAMKTYSEEKIMLLANAVLNSCYVDIEEEKLIVFLALIDQYTVSHIKTLAFYYNPMAYDIVALSDYYMGAPTKPLFAVYPELDNYLFNKIYGDLYNDGMVDTKNLNITMTGSGMVAKRTTQLADDFLRFIFVEHKMPCNIRDIFQ